METLVTVGVTLAMIALGMLLIHLLDNQHGRNGTSGSEGRKSP
ncbi:hypothetical protein ACIO93_20985 [Streptomyces sp. NPDC087903]